VSFRLTRSSHGRARCRGEHTSAGMAVAAARAAKVMTRRLVSCMAEVGLGGSGRVRVGEGKSWICV
jgi:hypothetical protein